MINALAYNASQSSDYDPSVTDSGYQTTSPQIPSCAYEIDTQCSDFPSPNCRFADTSSIDHLLHQTQTGSLSPEILSKTESLCRHIEEAVNVFMEYINMVKSRFPPPRGWSTWCKYK